MARTTDTERGAWMAFDAAIPRMFQPDLFSDALGVEFWRSIHVAAIATLDECVALKDALAAAEEANLG